MVRGTPWDEEPFLILQDDSARHLRALLGPLIPRSRSLVRLLARSFIHSFTADCFTLIERSPALFSKKHIGSLKFDTDHPWITRSEFGWKSQWTINLRDSKKRLQY